MPIFGYILADSSIFRILAQVDTFMYIMVYSEPRVYSGTSRTIDKLSQFRTQYAGISQDQLMQILNLTYAGSDIFES